MGTSEQQENVNLIQADWSNKGGGGLQCDQEHQHSTSNNNLEQATITHTHQHCLMCRNWFLILFVHLCTDLPTVSAEMRPQCVFMRNPEFHPA